MQEHDFDIPIPTITDVLGWKTEIQKGIERAQERGVVNLFWHQLGENSAAIRIAQDNERDFHLTEVISTSVITLEQTMIENQDALGHLIPPPIIIRGKVTPQNSFNSIVRFIDDYYPEIAGLRIRLKDNRGNRIKLQLLKQGKAA